jgi:2-oxoisovalerate ferredoxin oxidoreductase beta subunit
MTTLEALHQKPTSFYERFTRKSGNPEVTHYCPGCGHGALHKLIAEAIDDLGIQDQIILVSPVGCSVFAYHYFDVGNVQAAHGRACAVATGIKRSEPGSIVISYQGDGDLASIGIAETLHAANRGENITVFFVNNAIYGMTGGQMAPTTLIGQKTVTSPQGRNPLREGHPLRICELLSSLAGVSYLERVALAGPRHHMKARQAVRKALRCQMEGRGFSLVEVLSACPTGWKKTPADAWHWIEQQMLPVFPLGVFKEPPKTEAASRAWPVPAHADQVVSLLDLPSETPDERPLGNRARGECYSGIKIAGFGGQGVLSLGIILAIAGMKEGYRTSWLPSYGPEMRGGTAHCHVILSDQEIGAPLVDVPDILIAMNGPSLSAFQPHVRSGGLIVYDSSRVTRPPDLSQNNSIGIPASQIAQELGNSRVANLVALGAVLSRQRLMEHQPLLRREAIWQAIDEMVAQDPLRQLNRKALECGERLGLS